MPENKIGINCICEDCCTKFKSYHIDMGDCRSCRGEGQEWNEEEEYYITCLSCGGNGSNEWIETHKCYGCALKWLEDE